MTDKLTTQYLRQLDNLLQAYYKASSDNMMNYITEERYKINQELKRLKTHS